MERLTNEEATAGTVRAALGTLVGAAQPADPVILFLSGHGLQGEDEAFYFATPAIDASSARRVATTGLPWTDFAGLLERVEARIRGAVAWTTFVDDIDYDAKGQRERIEYGNGTFTEYTYDPLTYRLTRLKTTRSSDSTVLQNLRYVHDPVGNIVEIGDSAQQTVFFNNDVVSPSAQYVYDAVYRLIEATGP